MLRNIAKRTYGNSEAYAKEAGRMSGDKKQSDIVQRLSSAAAEAETIKEKLIQADSRSYDSIMGGLAADYQLIMDEAEQEIAEEYRATGNLTGVRICEINRGMDDYALSVQDVMMLLEQLQDQINALWSASHS